MNNTNLKKDIEVLRKELAEIEPILEKCLSKAPEGNISTNITHGAFSYYKRDTGSTKGEYLGKNCEDEIRALEQKAYDQAMLKDVKSQLASLSKIESILDTTPDANYSYDNLKPERRHLISKRLFGLEAQIQQTREEWQSHAEAWFTLGRRNTNLMTSKGQQVRSKSELIIADRLDKAGIPYTYEEALWLKEDGYLLPDFTVMNIRTGKKFLWEHLGMLDKPGYASENIARMEKLARNGFFPGENIILTFETNERPMNTEFIDLTIKHYLL